MKRSASPTPRSRSIQITRRHIHIALSPRRTWADSSKQKPICSKPCDLAHSIPEWAPSSINCSKAIQARSTVYFTYVCFATAHALKGDIDDAKSALTEARRLNPKHSAKWMLGTKSYPNYSQAWYDALRKAGLPEE